MVNSDIEAGGSVVEVSCSDLSVGDRNIVLPGDGIPADGIIRASRSTVDESSLGERLAEHLTRCGFNSYLRGYRLIACPCALGLVTPIAVLVWSNLFLIRNFSWSDQRVAFAWSEHFGDI